MRRATDGRGASFRGIEPAILSGDGFQEPRRCRRRAVAREVSPRGIGAASAAADSTRVSSTVVCTDLEFRKSSFRTRRARATKGITRTQLLGIDARAGASRKQIPSSLARDRGRRASCRPPGSSGGVSAGSRKEIDGGVIRRASADRRVRVPRSSRMRFFGSGRTSSKACRRVPPRPDDLGLYRGRVGARRGRRTRPPVDVLYRKNLARAVKTRRVNAESRSAKRCWHEIGHIEGLDEDDLRRRRME